VPRKLRDELTAYLQQRYGLADLLAVTRTDTQRAMFPTQKNPKRGFTANTLAQHFHYLYQRSGIEGASSHSGRRGFITNLADKGIHVRVLMALAGHQSIATTQRYIDLNPKMMRTAVEMI
jgi:integrase/recombinase XerD